MRKKITSHHRIPKHIWGSNHQSNILRVNEVKHRAIHTLLDNHKWQAQAPIEQLSQLFEMISEPIIWDIKEDIRQILMLAENIWMEAYKKECYNIIV